MYVVLQPGAAEVFLDFISYSGGPLPEELLPLTTCPVSILWGEADPWEPIDMGRAYGEYDCVEEFIPLPGVGHCCSVTYLWASPQSHDEGCACRPFS